MRGDRCCLWTSAAPEIQPVPVIQFPRLCEYDNIGLYALDRLKPLYSYRLPTFDQTGAHRSSN